MHLGMSLSQKLDPRLELDQKLEEKLAQKAKTVIALKQHLEIEHWVKGLIRWVDEHKRWQDFDKWGFKFQYGLIPSKMTPYKMAGFAHCFYDHFEALFGRISRGDWTIFVAEDLAPTEFREDVALHERGEEISLGNHYFASQLEFAGVKRGRKTGKYIKWIDTTYPTKFVDLTENVCSILPQELREELEQKGRENKETYLAQDMIDKYPLPTKVLELVVKYDDVNKNVEEMVIECVGPCQQAIYGASTIDEAVFSVNKIMAPILQKISGKQARVLVPGRMNAALKLPLSALREYFAKVTGKTLSLTDDFFTLYHLAKDKKQIVSVV